MNRRSFTGACVALCFMNAGGVTAHEPAPDGCGASSRDVAHELSVMRSPAISLTAGSDAAGWPRLALDKHYTGRYRISITSRHWIDIADGETIVESAGHFGPGCDVLHKIVEFDLTAGRKLTLQLSGQDDAIIGLAITASPPK